MAEKTDIVENEFGVDVSVQTIRGRACPVCNGKIIPSNRAVYQSAGDSSEVFALWECERCGFSERFEKPDDPKKLHGAPVKTVDKIENAGPVSGVKTLPPLDAVSSVTGTKATRRAAAKRAVPPDVEKMLEVMNRCQPKVES